MRAVGQARGAAVATVAGPRRSAMNYQYLGFGLFVIRSTEARNFENSNNKRKEYLNLGIITIEVMINPHPQQPINSALLDMDRSNLYYISCYRWGR